MFSSPPDPSAVPESGKGAKVRAEPAHPVPYPGAQTRNNACKTSFRPYASSEQQRQQRSQGKLANMTVIITARFLHLRHYNIEIFGFNARMLGIQPD